MTIIAAYQDTGTYRGAAAICGTTHKTVKRVVERAQAGCGGLRGGSDRVRVVPGIHDGGDQVCGRRAVEDPAFIW